MIQGGEAKLTTNLVVPQGLGIARSGHTLCGIQQRRRRSHARTLAPGDWHDRWATGRIAFLGWFWDHIGYLDVRQPTGYSSSVQILASGATPGLLQPGESETVPVYYDGSVVSTSSTPRSFSTLRRPDG